MRKLIMFATIFAVVIISLVMVGCDKPADVASRNVSTAADNFQIARRIVFYNGITDSYMLTIEGLCSLGNYDVAGELTVTCKVTDKDGNTAYIKDFLGLSDNVTYFVEQLVPTEVSTYQYKVIFRPSTIIPDIDLDLP